MGVFIFLFIALIFIQVISQAQIGKKKRLFQTISCFILLWLIQGLRHADIGIDSATSYRPYFEHLSVNWNSIFDLSDVFANYEIGYIELNKLFKFFISEDTQLFILFCSFLCIAPIAFIIYKYSTNIVFSFWIFSSLQIYLFGFSGIRQVIAIGFCCLSFHYIIKQRLLIFVALVLLASTIHTSAILFLPAYWLYHYIKLTAKKTFLALLAIIMLTFSFKTIAVTVVSILFGGEKYLSALSENTIPSYNLLIIFILVLFSTFLSKDENLVKLRSFVLMAVAFQTLGILSNHATRIGYYYYVYFMLVIPHIIDFRFTKIERKFITYAVCLLLCVFFFYVNGNGYLEVIPYKFFWE